MTKDRYLQAVRGLAIIAVVLIHCLPRSVFSLAVRPFLNWAVAAFIFLSGYLTNEHKVAEGGVLVRRLCKILPPYVAWSVLYAVVLQHLSLSGIVKAVFTGGAAAQMYFLFIYAQLTLLTPVLYRVLRSRRVLVYAICPVALLGHEVATAMGFGHPVVARLFPMWMIFYVVGLDWGHWRHLVEGKFERWLFVTCACLCIQLISGFAWNDFGDYSMATTQLKLSSMATSLATIGVIMSLPLTMRKGVSSSVLARLGDVSFGVYLSHILVLAIVGKCLGYLALPGLVVTGAIWILTLCGSWLFVVAAKEILPDKIAALLGC